MQSRHANATPRQIVLTVLLPSAIPSIFAGIRLGLGARLYLSGQILETEQVFAVLIVLATLGIVVTKLQDFIDLKLGRWRLS